MDHPIAAVERPGADRPGTGQATSPGGLRYHRPAIPMLEILETDPARFEIRTPWHVFTGDLGHGVVLQALRGEDGAPGPWICHSGNILEFRHRGRRASLDVESHLVRAGLERAPGRVVLWHESRLPLPHPARWRPGRRRDAALLLRYDYAILADSPVLHLTVTLRADPPEVTLDRPCLTTALDQMSPSAEGGAVRRALAWAASTDGAGASRPWPAPGGPGTLPVRLHEGAARHLAFPSEGGAPSQTCHLRLVDGGRLASVQGAAHGDGRLHWAVLRYAGASLGPGEPMILREERLLVPGGAAAEAPDEAGLDLARPVASPARPEALAPRPPAVFLGDRILAWTESRRRILLMPDDIDLTPSILEDGRWEWQVAATLRRLLAPGMRVADVGANIGAHTLVMADAVGPSGQVHAFEAHPVLAGLLADSVAMNGLGGVVTVHGGAAILDRDGGEVVLAAAERHRGSGHVVPARAAPGHEAAYPQRLAVPARTLDAALAGLGALDLLRMDVEGSEPLALRGAVGLIARSPRLRLLMEWSVPMMASRADVGALVAWLAGLGFRAWRIEPDASLCAIPDAALGALPHADLVFARDDPA